MMSHFCVIFCSFLLLFSTSAFEYVVAPNDDTYMVTLTDVSTNVSDIPTVFTNANATVHVEGIQWQTSAVVGEGAHLVYTTLLNDEVVETGNHSLEGLVPPSTILAGSLLIEEGGRHNLTVALTVQYASDPSIVTPTVSTTRLYQSYWPFVTLIPIGVMLLLAYLTGNVEISISTTNLISVVIAHGHLFRGMEHLVYGAILGALTDTYNGSVMLFIFFLSGISSLVEVTGGSKGLVRFVARYIRQTRVVQLLAFVSGVCYFWDDLLSILLLGHLFRPLLDAAHTSRPLAALLLDASAGPITGVVILSTWLLWEIPLLQQELSRIDTDQDIPALQMTPLEVLKESLRYAYYPIFMLLLIPLLLWSQRHIAHILMYERLSQVYQSKHGGPKDTHGPCQPNLPPNPDTPCRWWNSFNPIFLISILFLVFWYQTGVAITDPDYVPPPGEQWIVTTYAYSAVPLAWLQAISMASAFYVLSLLLQWQEGDNVLFLPFALPKIIKHHKAKKKKAKEEEEQREQADDKHAEQQLIENDGLYHSEREQDETEELFQPLIPMMELIGSFFFGFSRIMPYMIQFILAWALRQSWTAMGLDRWFASMFGEGLETMGVEWIPTAAFVTAFFMSLATGGASRGTAASVLLPMAVKPIYESTYTSDPSMVFQVIGAILSGCIAGDHAAPLSNTTLLSCLASDCHVIVHIVSQGPYIAVVFFLSLILGTGPVGLGLYPVGAGYFLGVCCILFFVFFLCYPILDPSGQWDLATRLYIRCWVKRCRKDDKEEDDEEEVDEDEEEEDGNFWEVLQRDTIRAATAMSQGLPYNTEDCRHLMHPVDTGITKTNAGEDNLHQTSSSCGSSIDEHNPTGRAYSEEEEMEDSENPPSSSTPGRPVRIIATDGRNPGGTQNDVIMGDSGATPA